MIHKNEVNQVVERCNCSSDLPSAFEILAIPTFKDRIPVIFLDFDGTLTSIVDNPEEAFLQPEMKKTLESVHGKFKCAILTGRDRADIERRVSINDLIYAGSHGYDIKGPDFEMIYESGIKVLPSLDNAEKVLLKELAEIPGVRIERKKFAIAVHYRNVPDDKVNKVFSSVSQVVIKDTHLKEGHGKMVIEVKPAINWHKGKALEWLMENLELSLEKYCPVFIGDDITDEDGFKIIRSAGYGILVGNHNQQTYASYTLKDPEEVKTFLDRLCSVDC